MEAEIKKYTDKELLSINNDLKRKKEFLDNKKSQLEQQLRNDITHYETCMEKLTKIYRDIDEKNELLEKMIVQNENADSDNKKNFINTEEIIKKCDDCFGEFVHGSIHSLEYEIRFGKTVLFRNISDENMTFRVLKEQLKAQFDRDLHEFFFVDEKNRIFLDDMNVKKALFPLSNVAVKNIIPKLFIKDIFDPDFINDLERENNLTSEDLLAKNSQKKIQLTLRQRFMRNLQSYRFVYANIFFYILFIIFWVLTCINFRSLKTLYLISSTYDASVFNPGISNVIKLHIIKFF